MEKADSPTITGAQKSLATFFSQILFRPQIGREVCGTCLYGLNIGFDGNVLFDVHAGYEIGDLFGNVREYTISELVRRQRKFAPLLFRNIDGFCPVRDKKWPSFLKSVIESHLDFSRIVF